MTAGVWSLIAASLALGGGQFEASSGAVLADGERPVQQQVDPKAAVFLVNRSAKTSRDALVSREVKTVTVAFQMGNLKNTSVVMRLPVAEAPRRRTIDNNPMKAKNKNRKTIIACEPIVSALTDAAKQLQPARCIT